MDGNSQRVCTTFDGNRRLASAPLSELVLVVKAAIEAGALGPVLTFEDATGRAVDIDTRGSAQEVLARLSPPGPADRDAAMPRGRGRPKLGVIPREVTLLPRHWDWLNAQPGGASVALRKLVEEARRGGDGKIRSREAQEAAYRFTAAMAGNEPGFEEALRALFAGDREKFQANTRGWPADVREYAFRLAEPAFSSDRRGTAEGCP